MKALDLYCGAGGASIGLYQAGFTTIVGIAMQASPDLNLKHDAGKRRHQQELRETLPIRFYPRR